MRAVWLAIAFSGVVSAQGLTLEEAVRRAVERYPSVKVSREQASAAAAGIALARTSYLPKVDFLAAVNRATRNNIYGMLMPQSVIAPISGPPVREASGSSVFGSAIGLHVAWEPFDFGLRKSEVDAAESVRRRAELATERTKFDVSSSAAAAFLTILAAEETVKAATAGVERAKAVEGIVGALVKAELRPGADAARARAEVAAAETQLIQARQSVALAKASLAQLVGGEVVGVEAEKLLAEAPGSTAAESAPATHPALREQNAAIDTVRARQKILDKSVFPKFQVESSTYARGTGARPDFTTLGGANGLAPNFYNWGLGFTMNFGLTELMTIKQRRDVESAHERTEKAKLEQMQTDLAAQLKRAQALMDGARQVAAVTPVALEASRVSEEQATARYRAGLGTMVEVAEAQRIRTQAEIDARLARLGVWRGMLEASIATGSLDEFIAKAKGN
ncbi:MAG: TolC family protein [Bryobacterales bacterium]|nr:TolC family protein [Bryobacterales bacterium]